MIMGGEVYLGDATTDQSWTIGRRLGLQIAAHILSPFGIRPIFDKLAAGTGGNGHDRDRTGQPVHPHDRHVGHGLAEGQGRRRAGLDRVPDRDEHAARHAADPQDAEAGHGAVALRGRGMHADGGLLHADALVHESAAHAREPDDPRQSQRESEPAESAGLGTSTIRGNRPRLRLSPIGRRRPPAYRPRSRRATCCATPP